MRRRNLNPPIPLCGIVPPLKKEGFKAPFLQGELSAGLRGLAVRGILTLVVLLLLTFSVHQVLALSESQKRMPQDMVFNNVGYSGINVSVGSSQIQLGKDSNWWDLNWNYKKQLTVKNLGSSAVNNNSTAQVTIDTNTLGLGTTKLQSDLDDLRIVYAVGATPVFTELPRTINQTIGQTNVVMIAFPLQASVGATTTDSNYYLYYGNPSANSPSFPKEKGLSFDGGDVAAVGSTLYGLVGNSDMTMCTWVNPSVSDGTIRRIVTYATNSTNGFQLSTAGNKFYFQAAKQGSKYGASMNGKINSWQYICGSFNNTTSDIAISVDGVLQVGTTDNSYSITTASGNLILGNLDFVNDRYYYGKLDEISIWNRILTTTETEARKNKELDSSDVYWSNLVGYWKLNDGLGQTFVDASRNGISGVLGQNSSIEAKDPTWFNNNLAYNIGSKTATLVAPLNGTTTALVAGGTGVPTTATGALRYTTKGAMIFDGKNDYVGIGNSIASTTNNYSVSMWIYPQSAAGNQLFFDSRPAANMPRNIRVWTVGSQIYLGLGGYGVTQINLPANWINNWHQVTQTFNWNGSSYEIKGYIDGAYIGTDTNATGTIIFNSNFSVGMGYVSSTQTFGKAKIDEVAILDRVLSASEITSLYNSGSPSPITPDSSTKLLYHFDENGDDPRLSGKVFDSSGNNNNGTIYGAKYTDGIVLAGELSHQGVMLEEGTTNVVTNPSFEANVTTGWINKITQNYGNGTTDADGNTLIGSTVVNDVFFYDTTKDSDSGAWRNNATAQASSWYNEGFSATRGKKREFPEKSYIIATNLDVSIVDAVENKLWMRFTNSSGNMLVGAQITRTPQSVYGLNGEVYIGNKDFSGSNNGDFVAVKFKSDGAVVYPATTGRYTYSGTLGGRNSGSGYVGSSDGVYFINSQINDISVANVGGTQYVAVATDGGVSVLNETVGSVINYVDTTFKYDSVWLTSKGDLYFGRPWPNNQATNSFILAIYKIQNKTNGFSYDYMYQYALPPSIGKGETTQSGLTHIFVTEGTSTIDGNSNTLYVGMDRSYVGNLGNLAVIQEKQGDESNGSVKYYTKNFVSEEMVGDIRGMWPLYGETGINPTIQSASSFYNGANSVAELSVGNTGRPWGGSGGSNGEIQSGDYERAIRGNGLKFDGVGDYLKQKVYQTEVGSIWGPATNNFSLASGQAFFRSGEVLGSELLTNGNMETGNPPSNWALQIGNSASAANDQGPGGVGNFSYESIYGGTATWAAIETVNLTLGSVYKLSGWVRSVDGGYCGLALAKPDSSPFYFSGSLTSTSWTYVQTVVTTTVTGMHPVVLVNSSLNKRCHYDDISVKPVTSPSLAAYKGNDSGRHRLCWW